MKLLALAEQVIRLYSSKTLHLACAESCTGGLLAAALTDIPGASRVFWGSFVTYTNEAKQVMLGVKAKVLDTYGAVSRETAVKMAESARKQSRADVALAITGLAGPQGDGRDTKLGTVWIALSSRGYGSYAKSFIFSGNRADIRNAAVFEALKSAMEIIT